MMILIQSCGLGLFGSPGEDEPAVERGSPAFAATAGSDPEGVSHMLDGIAKANLLVANEPGKARAVGLAAFAFGLFLRHGGQVSALVEHLFDIDVTKFQR
jgi:hypothetical protein